MAAVPSKCRADRLGASPAEVAGRLYEAHHQRVLRYCFACLRNREEAEDAAQSTFLYAFRALERGIEPEAEVAWLLAIARNVCMARHRLRGRRRERETPHDPVVLQDVSAAPERTDGLVGLEDALARLPEMQRQAILLREWRGFSYREIADELGLSGAAVETLIFRARRSLAEQLDGERAQERRRALRGLDLGSAATALRSLLGGGTAAKLVLAGATVASVVAVAGGTFSREQPRVETTHQPGARTTPTRAAETREQTTLPVRAAARAPVWSTPTPTPKPKGQAASPGDSRRSGPVDVVEDTVKTIGAEVGAIAPQLPETNPPALPDPPVELPSVPELSTPELPLP